MELRWSIVHSVQHGYHIMIMFDKSSMLAELREFMLDFTLEVGFCFGDKAAAACLPPEIALGESMLDSPPDVFKDYPFWRTMDAMYDYAVHGIAVEPGPFELNLTLLLTVDRPWERLPPLVLNTVLLAEQRNVLDGHSRQLTAKDPAPAGYFTIGELSLLAAMDERSVRNAANPKLGAAALITEQIGKRSLVAVPEARRWLAGRKGFKSTSISSRAKEPDETFSTLLLPTQTISRLEAIAKARGTSVDDLVIQLVNTEAKAT